MRTLMRSARLGLHSNPVDIDESSPMVGSPFAFRSSGAPTAGHQAQAAGALHIVCTLGLASYRRSPLSSNRKLTGMATAAAISTLRKVLRMGLSSWVDSSDERTNLAQSAFLTSRTSCGKDR